MSKYIDKDLLISELECLHENERLKYMGVFDTINSMPEADVAEVIRCKDCKYWDKLNEGLQGRCILSGNYPTGTWYCANAERKDEQ